EAQRDELVQKLAELESGKESTQSEWRTKLESSKAEWNAERSALQKERDELTRKLADSAKLQTERDELVQKLAELEAGRRSTQDELRTKLESSQAQWRTERSALQKECDELTRKLANYASLQLERDDLLQKVDEFQTQQHAGQSEWRNQLLDFEGRLREQQQ